MARIRNLVIGGAVGAALTYFLDPELGPSRRARVQQQLMSTLGRGRRQVAGPRTGTTELAAATLADDDLTVLSRVESVLGDLPGYPRDRVELEVEQGRLVLRGEVESEARATEIAEAASHVRGVTSVDNHLHADGLPAAPKPVARRASGAAAAPRPAGRPAAKRSRPAGSGE